MSQAIGDEPARVSMSPNLTATLTRAANFARQQSHARVTLEHLLLALTEDAEAALILAASTIAVNEMAAVVAAHLASTEAAVETSGASQLSISPDLKRVLDAAGAAAQQGRRQVNGAIVLAAIVGDGKSVAAQLLRAQGLTFDSAIKALQRTVQAGPAPRSQPAVSPSPQQAVPPNAPAPAMMAPPRSAVLDPGAQQESARRQPPASQPPPPVDAEAAPAAVRPPPLPEVRTAPEAAPLGSGPSPHRHEEAPRVELPVEVVAWPSPDPAGPQDQQHNPEPEPRAAAQRDRPRGGQHQRVDTPAERERPRRQSKPPPELTNRKPAADASDAAGGQLIENIPRMMRVGTLVAVEVRLVRNDQGLANDAPNQHYAQLAARAMTVRLTAPSGDFQIETVRPETQWIEGPLPGQGQALARWHWMVTPLHHGEVHLQIAVSARWVGPEGLSAHMPLPEQLVTIDVQRDIGGSLTRLFGWIAVATAGGVLALAGRWLLMLLTSGRS